MEFAAYHEKRPWQVHQSDAQKGETIRSGKNSLLSQHRKPASTQKKVMIPLLVLAGLFVLSLFLWYFMIGPYTDVYPIDSVGIAEEPTDSVVHSEMPDIAILSESEPQPMPAPRLVTEASVLAPAVSAPVALDLPEKPTPGPDPQEKPELSTKVRGGIDAYNAGQYHLSIELMEGVLSLDPENIGAFYYMSEAKKRLEEVIQPLFESARQEYDKGYYAESVKKLEHILQIDPSHSASKQYLDLARTNLSSQQIGLVVHQYVRSVENHELHGFYKRNCTPTLFDSLDDNVSHMVAIYLQMNVSVWNLSIRYTDMNRATVSFNCRLTGLYNPDDERQVLFEGLQEWIVQRESDRWVIANIEFKS
jgi:hypothetical protein